MPVPGWTTLTRRILGSLWIVDGLLQGQPLMFTHAVVLQVFAPAAAGNPALVQALMRWGMAIWAAHPVVANGSAEGIQIVIGLLLWHSNRTLWRAGLILSFAWAMVVWVFGEGLGAVLTRAPTILTGAPGSAIVYAFFSVVLLLATAPAAGGGRYAHKLLRFGLAAYWGLGAFWQFRPVYFRPLSLLEIVAGNQGLSEPNALARGLGAAAELVGRRPADLNLAMGLLMAVLCVETLTRPRPGAVLTWAALGFLALIWGIFMDFGVFGGTGTDPNTAPVAALMMVALVLAGRAATAPASASHSADGTHIHPPVPYSRPRTGPTFDRRISAEEREDRSGNASRS